MSGKNEAFRPPHNWRRWAWVVLGQGCRYVLGAVFLMAAVTKVTDLRGFEDQVLLHANLSPWLAGGVVKVLPWLELTCGVCLVLGYAAREAALLTGLMLFSFLVRGLLAPPEVECGCFLFPTPAAFAAGRWQVVRDLLLLLCSVRVTWGKDRK